MTSNHEYVDVMADTGYDAFWSYTHEDNDRAHNRVLDLAQALKNEYALVTDSELRLFVDREDLSWGNNWRNVISGAVAEVPFFIPVITPKFVNSVECRREFLQFSGAAKSRGTDRLLLPILWIPVDDLTEDSDDEVRALIARTQYVDWTKLRNLAFDNPVMLDAMSELALTLAALRRATGVVTITEEAKSPTEAGADFREAINEINKRLEVWIESVEFDQIERQHWSTTRNERLARAARLAQGRGSAGAVRSVYMRMGSDLLPIAEQRLKKAQDYARLTIELDPFVTKAIRLASHHRELSPELDVLRDGVNEAWSNMAPSSPVGTGYGLRPEHRTLNAHLKLTSEILDQSFVFSDDGNAIVREWRDKLLELDGPPILPLIRSQEPRAFGRDAHDNMVILPRHGIYESDSNNESAI